MNNQLDIQPIDEFFSVPVGLKEVESIYGFKLYSSDALVKSFLNAIQSSSRGHNVYKPIEKLVKQKRIMIVYQVKGLLSFLSHKMFGSPEDKSIMGFFNMTSKKVYIMIDNNISIFGVANNDLIASTTMHECQHLFASLNWKKFLSLYKDELYRYYVSAFSRIFSLTKIPKEMPKIIYFIGQLEGTMKRERILGQLDAYGKILKKYLKPASKLSSDKFDEVLYDFQASIRLFVKYFDIFVRSYRNYINIFGPLDMAYRDAFSKRNSYTTAYQELIAPSEVICVLTEIKPTHPKVKRAFKEFS